MNKKVIRLLIADDHEIVREGFHTMLARRSDIQLVAEAKNGTELIEFTDRFDPDVIITDIKMPKIDGVEATRIITERHPNIPIIAFTMFDEESLIVDMLEAGAQGYIVKSASKEEILEALTTVLERKTYYCRQTTARLAFIIAHSNFDPTRKMAPKLFNKKEQDIIKLICEEFSNREIGESMHLSPRTVEGYRERIQEKMGVKNTAGIVVYAIRKGIFKIHMY